MADHAQHADDIPQMDYPEHERTYSGFIHFSEVGTVACLAIVAALAVGGTKHAWGTAVIGTLLTLVGTGVGLASRGISWRAPLVALLLMLFALVVY